MDTRWLRSFLLDALEPGAPERLDPESLARIVACALALGRGELSGSLAHPDREEAWRRLVLVALWETPARTSRLTAYAVRYCTRDMRRAVEVARVALESLRFVALEIGAPFDVPLETREDGVRSAWRFLCRCARGEGKRGSRKEVRDERTAERADAAGVEDGTPHALMMAVFLAASSTPRLIEKHSLAYPLRLMEQMFTRQRGLGVTPADSQNKKVLRGHLRLWTGVCRELEGALRRWLGDRLTSDPRQWAALWALPDGTSVIGDWAGDAPEVVEEALGAARAWRDEELRPRVPFAVDRAFGESLLRRSFRQYFRRGDSFRTIARRLGPELLDSIRSQTPRRLSADMAACQLLVGNLPAFQESLATAFRAQDADERR